MKNIWILNHYASLGSGRHYKLAENLVKRGYIVKLFAASTIHNSNKNRITDSTKYIVEEKKDVPCVYIKARSYTRNGKARIKNMFDYALGLVFVSKNFKNEKPDIIIASSVHPLTWIAGYFLSKKYNTKFVSETRDLWPKTLIDMKIIKESSIASTILHKLEKVIYKKSDIILFTMEGGKDYVKSIGLSNQKVRYINNGVDLEEYNYNKMNHIYEDKDLDNNNVFNVIYTGSMGQPNALIVLLEAALIIQNKGYKDIQFILFGVGNQKEKLERFAIENNLKNIYFKGRVNKKYIPSILSKSNLNVFVGEHVDLYKYGVSLNKMFEYFASGKPIISNIECNYNLIKRYSCGVTVKSDSDTALAKGILDIYNLNTKDYESYSRNSLIAASDFDFEKLTDRLESIIQEL